MIQAWVGLHSTVTGCGDRFRVSSCFWTIENNLLILNVMLVLPVTWSPWAPLFLFQPQCMDVLLELDVALLLSLASFFFPLVAIFGIAVKNFPLAKYSILPTEHHCQSDVGETADWTPPATNMVNNHSLCYMFYYVCAWVLEYFI